MAGFDLSAVLKDVSKLDTEEQIVKIDLDLIDPDPDNFYLLTDLDELAANIETIGLQQPLRVRPGNDGRFVIVSGHRRRAACMMIRDGGSDMFAQGVPCIVEYGEGSRAMQELRLIYANSATRVLSAAEISKQAERVEALLYELQAQGMVFPGRMRDHVAAACQASKSKLARLHAIRANLIPELLAYFDSNEMVEDVAYQLSRFPVDIQEALSDKLADGRKRKMPIGSTVDAVYRNLKDLQKPFPCRAHAGGPDCHNLTGKIVRSLLFPYSWGICDEGRCCIDCYRSKEGCSGMCREARDRVKLDAAVEEEEKKKRADEADRAHEALKKRIQKRAKVLLPYAEQAKLAEDGRISSDYQSATVSQLRQWSKGEFGDKHFYSDDCLYPRFTKDAAEMARRLGCSPELAMGLPEKKPEPPVFVPFSTAVWETGTPADPGWYAVKLNFLGSNLDAPRVFWWTGDAWTIAADGSRPVDRAYKVYKWLWLPKEVQP